MRSILLLLSRNGRRWLCAAALAFAWLGVCQPAAAAVSCTASTQGAMVIYTGAAITNAELLTTVSCTGLTIGPSGGNQNKFIMCTTGDAATSTGTGGSTVAPYRMAKSAAGNTLNYQLTTTSYFSNVAITSAGVRLMASGLGFSSDTGVSQQQNGGRTPLVTVPASQAPVAGDYVSMVPITVEIRAINQAANMTSCTEGVSAGMVVLNIPVTIRVGGAACAINNVDNWDFGDISVTSGTVAAVNSGATGINVNLTCASGTAWTATLSDGNNPDGTTGTYRRRMINGGSYLTYSLSLGAGSGRTSPTAKETGTGTGSTDRFNIDVAIPSQTPASLTQGVYRDTVMLSVSY